MGTKCLSLAVASALVCAAACANDAPVAPRVAPSADSVTLSGTYGLATLGGLALPQTIGTTGLGTLDVLSGSIRLNADGSYSDVLNFRRRGANGIEVFADTLRGNFVQLNEILVMTPRGGDTELVDLRSSGALGVSLYGMYLIYQRAAAVQ